MMALLCSATISGSPNQCISPTLPASLSSHCPSLAPGAHLSNSREGASSFKPVFWPAVKVIFLKSKAIMFQTCNIINQSVKWNSIRNNPFRHFPSRLPASFRVHYATSSIWFSYGGPVGAFGMENPFLLFDLKIPHNSSSFFQHAPPSLTGLSEFRLKVYLVEISNSSVTKQTHLGDPVPLLSFWLYKIKVNACMSDYALK